MRNNLGQFVKGSTFPEEWRKSWIEKRTQHPKLKSSSELAYVLGAILGDGNIYKTKVTRSHRAGYRIRLTAKDLDFVEAVNRALSKVIGREAYPIRKAEMKSTWGKGTYFELTAHSKGAFIILSDFDKMTNVAECFPCEFIRGFADAEGGVFHNKRKNRVSYERVVYMVNTRLEILELIAFLLEKLKIESTISSYMYRKEKRCYRLSIYQNTSLLRYYEKIGFSIKRKMAKLIEAIGTIKVFRRKIPPQQEIVALSSEGLSQKEIGKIYGVSQGTISNWFRRGC